MVYVVVRRTGDHQSPNSVFKTAVSLLQQLPPKFICLLCSWMLPSAPDLNPEFDGFAHGAQAMVLSVPPYDRQKSMPKYMPVW